MFLPGDLSKSGEEEAYDSATMGRNLNQLQDILSIRRDPFFNYMVATETGADTFPYEQLVQPGNPWSMGGMGGGGGGGGGGYGGGGGGGGMFLTPNIDMARGSGDDDIQDIVAQMDKGVDPWTVKQQIRASGVTDAGSAR